MDRPLRGQGSPDGRSEARSRESKPIPSFFREGLGWLLALQLLLALLWVGPLRAPLSHGFQFAVSLRMAPASPEQPAWLPGPLATGTDPQRLMEVLRIGSHKARVWWKVADTVRRHAAPLMRAELESWWCEALASRSAPEASCAC
ncbi:hypothetical protein [Corallococcus carmarthensis]|uniref:Uncharacterized protein n=1 Tax=Corallococcus carmarthensis TaxID=2316728 RepID=A0A3A8JR22_9BACT|nr:hypothetical protein [Corallococcus carmarthensis]NOK21333.1 hypothetical protein [Corallococcus carmarthensis]RKG97386.1 hypothetical protein D7X32_32790 [Corallococcus carmarthensis]